MLNVVIENSGNVVILHCSGRMVAGEEPWTLFNTVISLKDKRVVVLDLTKVSKTDAHGLGVLVFLKQWATGAGVRLELIPSKPVLELLHLTGLDSILEIRPAKNIASAAGLMIGSHEDGTVASRCG
jgi:anti-anti-sigma factor